MNATDLGRIVDKIEASTSLFELREVLQNYIENRGFQSFSFIENELGSHSDPLIVNTISKAWDQDYRDNDFLSIDPCLPIAQRTNTPFTWATVPKPQKKGIRKPRALKLMEAAQDHGFSEGLVVPFHFRDQIGAYHSTVCTLFWTSSVSDFVKRMRFNKAELHLVLIYWAEQAIKVQSINKSPKTMYADNSLLHLTDRERDVLSWAANGKTIDETSVILGISPETANGYMKDAIRKLGAVSKTQAVVRAISEGLIRL
jgi:DNA-binding CsgD family transcriptional regulator